jgi:hypothetical protein
MVTWAIGLWSDKMVLVGKRKQEYGRRTQNETVPAEFKYCNNKDARICCLGGDRFISVNETLRINGNQSAIYP